MTEDLIKANIMRARKWARKHFNVGQEEDHIWAPPTFDMEFPNPDEIQVWARCYGRRMYPSVTYKLAWRDEQLMWVCRNPFSGAKTELVVEEMR